MGWNVMTRTTRLERSATSERTVVAEVVARHLTGRLRGRSVGHQCSARTLTSSATTGRKGDCCVPHVTTLAIGWTVAFLVAHSCAYGAPKMEPEPARVEEIAAMLCEQPGTFGAPIDDRAAWEALAKKDAFRYTVTHAEPLLAKPFPRLTDATYRAIVKSGSRVDAYGLLRERSGRLPRLCRAECIENKGRFLPKIEELIPALCDEKTWIIPLRKQESIDNMEGKRNTIDLTKAMRAWNMAMADRLLGDRLRPATRQMIRENLERRVFAPYRKMITGKQKPDFWLSCTSNWNAVCLAGVTGAALTILDSREDRAFFAAAAEMHSKGFLKGFLADGYCTEGLGYWNFGFSHYLALAEALWQATSGKLDLFDVPNMESIALFGARIEIHEGVYPAIADCSPNTRPMELVMHFMSRRLRLGLDDWERGDMATASGGLYFQMLSACPNSASMTPPAETRVRSVGPRSYFQDTGVLICRPGPDSSARLAAALKGGHNAEHHNHNDVGSFVVAVDAGAPILDVGAEVYTNRTFSSKRYESRVLNSYGHSVPLVAGRLQSKGRQACARVLKADFAPAGDTFVLDLKAAYDVPELRRLERTFVYSRRGDGALTVTDRVEFASSQTFGTTLMTLGQWERLSPTSLTIRDGDGAVRVDIEASANFDVTAEELDEALRIDAKATRLGINLREPVPRATIAMRITPLADPARDSDRLVRNGGFEEGLAGWQLRDNGMSALSTEQAASGRASLKVVDAAKNSGSNAVSDLIRAKPDAAYELRGQVLARSGKGVGVYIRLLGRRRGLLQTTSAERRKAHVTAGAEPSNRWQPFSLRFRTTPQTRYAQIWLHSYNASLAEAYLDDFELVPVPGR